ncbi:hypothetical protein D3C85_1465480 [compost metagenome]
MIGCYRIWLNKAGELQHISDMDNQRIVGGSAFCCENLLNRCRIRCIRTQSIHRFSRKCDRTALLQETRCLLYILRYRALFTMIHVPVGCHNQSHPYLYKINGYVRSHSSY